MKLLKYILFIGFVMNAASCLAIDYWVSNSGSNSNDCKAADCASIQKAISLARAGDTVYIRPGLYTESSANNAFTSACHWFATVASLCINSSGVSGNPIVISAAPGAEAGSVVIDNQNLRVGVVLNYNDYITFRGLKIINSVRNAIANESQAGNDVANQSLLAKGIVIENSQFFKVTTPESGDNIAAIGAWGSQDWIIRNNYIDGVEGGSGIRGYGVINALVENNTIKNVSEGVLWKDHFVLNLTTRGFVDESEIRYNLITASAFGIRIQIRGSRTPESGHNYIHHNIISGIRRAEDGAGISVAMAEAYAQSGKLYASNNLVDCSSASGVSGVGVDSSIDMQVVGNIFYKCGYGISAIKSPLVAVNSPNIVRLTVSNNNLFLGTFSVVMDRYNSAAKFYRDLATWQKAKDVDSISLAFDGPDLLSKYAAAADSAFVTASVKPYEYSASSPALRMMPDGTNAGPYQVGTEVIGVLSLVDIDSRPLPPISGGVEVTN
jgi:hypothetical protein